jgi:uncharacterized protein
MATKRTRVRRAPARGVYERGAIDAILDEGLVGHLGFVDDDQPFVIPTLYARVGDILYIHGSSASRAIRRLTDGIPACLTVTLLDGVVLARSVFHHSMNYRSVVVLGTCRPVEGPQERETALLAFTERMVPGRWDEVRPPSAKELKATRVLSMDLTECSAKARTGPPVDDETDYALPVWAGEIPLQTVAGPLIPDPRLTDGIEPSAQVAGWLPGAGRGREAVSA